MGNQKILFFVIVCMITFYVPCFSETDTSLDLLIEEALKNNPRIQTAFHEWEASHYKIFQEYSLPDPTANYTYFGESVETRVGPQENKYGGSIKIPFPSKLYLKGKAQVQHARALKQQYEATKREVIKEVKFVYYDIYWMDKAIDITEQEKSVVSGIEKVATKKYETNRAKQQEVIKAQIELGKFSDRLLRLKQHRKALVAKMNSLLSRVPGTAVYVPDDIALPVFDYSLEELSEKAIRTEQGIIAAKMAVQKARYERSLARQSFIPDLTLGFDYIQTGEGSIAGPDNGQDAWMTTFSVNVPLWFNKQFGEIKEKEARLKARQKNVKNLENETLYEVEDMYYKVLTYEEIVTLYRTALVPQSKQSMNATKSGYENGDLNFIDWLDSERVLLKTKLAYHKAIVDYMRSIAFLERIVGQDLYPTDNKRSENAVQTE